MDSKLKDRYKAIWKIFITNVFASSPSNRLRRSKSKGSSQSELILFVISPADVNSPSNLGRYPDKVYSIYELAIKLGYRSKIVFHPMVATKKVSSSVPIVRIERIARNFSIAFKLLSNSEEFREEDSLRDRWNSLGVLEKIRYYVWKDFLDLTNPKIVFGIDIRESEALACKVKSIPIFEVMHGTFSAEELPLRRFSKGMTRTIQVDMFLTWDSHYSRISEALNVPTKVIGHPNKKYLDAKGIKPDQFNKKVLVTLAWGVEKSKDPFGIIHSGLADIISELKSHSFNLIFRLHPVTTDKHKRSINAIRTWFEFNFPGSHVSLPENSSLLEELQSVHLHITHESSAFYEAGLLGVPTIFTSRRGYEAIPKEYIDTGSIHLWEGNENFRLTDIKISNGEKFGNYFDISIVTELITQNTSLRKSRP
jgi:hypothetical protein